MFYRIPVFVVRRARLYAKRRNDHPIIKRNIFTIRHRRKYGLRSIPLRYVHILFIKSCSSTVAMLITSFPTQFINRALLNVYTR